MAPLIFGVIICGHLPMGKENPYQFASPSKESALATFQRAYSTEEAQALWNQACQATEVKDPPSTLNELANIFDYLSKLPGRQGVYGTSLKLRLLTYRKLVVDFAK